MDDKLIFAAAFAGALQAERKHAFEVTVEDDPDGHDEWLMRTSVVAAVAAVETVDALYIAYRAINQLEVVAQDTAHPEQAAVAHERWVALDWIHHAIEAYREGFEDEDEVEDCEYACDGTCGNSHECMTCEGDDRAKITQSVALIKKMRDGQHDA
jgi:hypothetical protein